MNQAKSITSLYSISVFHIKALYVFLAACVALFLHEINAYFYILGFEEHLSDVPENVDLAFWASGAYIGYLYIFLFLVCAVFHCNWIYRFVANLSIQYPGEMKHSPRYSVICHFIPLLNLFQPFGVVKQMLQKVSNYDAEQATYDGYGLLITWWLTWVASNFLGRASMSMWDKADSIRGYEIANKVDLLSSVIILTCMFAFITLYGKLNYRHNKMLGIESKRMTSESIFEAKHFILVLIGGALIFGVSKYIANMKHGVSEYSLLPSVYELSARDKINLELDEMVINTKADLPMVIDDTTQAIDVKREENVWVIVMQITQPKDSYEQRYSLELVQKQLERSNISYYCNSDGFNYYRANAVPVRWDYVDINMELMFSTDAKVIECFQ